MVRELKKRKEIEEARKMGLAPPEKDEDGNEINPHIPHYLSSAPWYLKSDGPGLKHQRKWKSDPNYTKSSYDRGAKVFQAHVYRKGACANCGAMTHVAKSCVERPRTVGAKWNNKCIAPDEKIETIEIDYAGKHDRWNGCDLARHALVVERLYAMREEARRKHLVEKKLKRCEEEGQNNIHQNKNDDDGDEAKLDESEQRGFVQHKKRVRTTGGGITGTVRTLRIREDIPKYLINLDVNSAHYDPKTRSMREDPNPDSDPNEKFYEGDNQHRNSGEAVEFKQLLFHAREAFDKGQDIHIQAAPSQAELLFRNHKEIREKLQSRVKDAIRQKYGNAGTEEENPSRELP